MTLYNCCISKCSVSCTLCRVEYGCISPHCYIYSNHIATAQKCNIYIYIYTVVSISSIQVFMYDWSINQYI